MEKIIFNILIWFTALVSVLVASFILWFLGAYKHLKEEEVGNV